MSPLMIAPQPKSSQSQFPLCQQWSNIKEWRLNLTSIRSMSQEVKLFPQPLFQQSQLALQRPTQSQKLSRTQVMLSHKTQQRKLFLPHLQLNSRRLKMQLTTQLQVQKSQKSQFHQSQHWRVTREWLLNQDGRNMSHQVVQSLCQTLSLTHQLAPIKSIQTRKLSRIQVRLYQKRVFQRNHFLHLLFMSHLIMKLRRKRNKWKRTWKNLIKLLESIKSKWRKLKKLERKKLKKLTRR